MSHDPYAEIALVDIGEACQNLIAEGTPASHVLTALLFHAAGIAKFANLSPHKAATAFANFINDPDYQASKGPRPHINS